MSAFLRVLCDFGGQLFDNPKTWDLHWNNGDVDDLAAQPTATGTGPARGTGSIPGGVTGGGVSHQEMADLVNGAALDASLDDLSGALAREQNRRDNPLTDIYEVPSPLGGPTDAEIIADFLDIEAQIVGIFNEPIDWINTAREIWNEPKNPWSYAGFLPLVPAAVSRYGDEVADAAKAVDMPGTAVTRGNKHHSDPKFMGGNPKQPTTEMSIPDHKALHKDLNDFLRRKTDAAGNHMRPQRGNSADRIAEKFSRHERLNAMAEFYKKFRTKYPDASRNFFEQHPHLE